MSLYAKDALLVATGALPNGSSAATYTAGMDMGLTKIGEVAHLGEFEIASPVLTTSALPDTKTMTYAVVVGTNSTFTNPVLIYDSVLVATGAGGTGAAAATARFRLPINPGGIGNSNTFVGVRATNSGTGNASAVNASLSFIF